MVLLVCEWGSALIKGNIMVFQTRVLEGYLEMKMWGGGACSSAHDESEIAADGERCR